MRNQKFDAAAFDERLNDSSRVAINRFSDFFWGLSNAQTLKLTQTHNQTGFIGLSLIFSGLKIKLNFDNKSNTFM